MKVLPHLFDNNRDWAKKRTDQDPEFFKRLANQQNPDILWIGCSDSRVPANELIGLAPGEVFVHRNIANVVVHSDFNCLSVIEYAVNILKVEHVIVCGHYSCGGVAAASQDSQVGLIDNWLRHIRDVRNKHLAELNAIEDQTKRLQRMCELNVIEQVHNVCYTSVVQNAWQNGQVLAVHGWVYDVGDGMLHDLDATKTGVADVTESYRVGAKP